MGKVLSCNQQTTSEESNIVVPDSRDNNEAFEAPPLLEINFTNIIKEIVDCDITANQIRFETYDLKGFNSMTPNVKQEKAEKTKAFKNVKWFKSDNINITNPIQTNLTPDEIEEINNLTRTRIKSEECNFGEFMINDVQLNKYGNINLVNALYTLSKINKGYIKKLFSKFEYENGWFSWILFKKGKIKKIWIDNKIPKKSPFLTCNDSNFWWLLIEKAVAKIYHHYINTIPWLASSLFMNWIPPTSRIVLRHSEMDKKDAFNIMKEKVKWPPDSDPHYIWYSEKDSYTNEYYVKEHNISFFIKSLFKIGTHKYVEIYLPCIYAETAITIDSVIDDKDKDNKEFFPDDKINNKHYIFYLFNTFYKNFSHTYIEQYSPKSFYNSKTIIWSDRNINWIKFNVEHKTKISLSIHLQHPTQFRFILSKLSIIENYIRHIHTMSSQIDSNADDNNSRYSHEVDYNFDYISSIYKFDYEGFIDADLENGIYCLWFNAYTNDKINVNIGASSQQPIEFMDDAEKTEMKWNWGIKSLFTSYLKHKESNAKIETVSNTNNAIRKYESLINPDLGYSIFMIENDSIQYNAFVKMEMEIKGMNWITKDYNDDHIISLISSPKNHELIVFEWEKNIDEVSIWIDVCVNVQQIQTVFNAENFMSLPRKYIGNSNVYYIEIQYRRGVFLVFVNEHEKYDYIIQVIFEQLENWEYKEIKTDALKGKKMELEIQSRCYISYNWKCETDNEFSYKWSWKVTKNEKVIDERNNNNNNNLIIQNKG